MLDRHSASVYVCMQNCSQCFLYLIPIRSKNVSSIAIIRTQTISYCHFCGTTENIHILEMHRNADEKAQTHI